MRQYTVAFHHIIIIRTILLLYGCVTLETTGFYDVFMMYGVLASRFICYSVFVFVNLKITRYYI